MANIYSHSRLSTFEQCPFKFKLKYIDKIPEEKTTIEAHLGSVVHSTLEWLYKKVKENKIPEIDELITYYVAEWEKDYTPEIIIVKKEFSVKDYFNKGVEFLINYYTAHKPFDKEKTLEIEKRILIKLEESGEYKLQGFIDRLVYNPKHERYEVHDYKTANFLPAQNKFDKDRQLALYSIAIKETYGHEKEVVLVWHYLAHNKKIISKRTNEQLQKLKTETLELIKKIESTDKFPHYISKLCDWCGYKEYCPAWNGKPPATQTKLKQFETKEDLRKEGELDIW